MFRRKSFAAALLQDSVRVGGGQISLAVETPERIAPLRKKKLIQLNDARIYL